MKTATKSELKIDFKKAWKRNVKDGKKNLWKAINRMNTVNEFFIKIDKK